MSDLTTRVHRSVETMPENPWNNVVTQAALGSVFHRHEWLRAHDAGYGEPARHLVAERDGNPVGVFPNVVGPLGPFERLTSMSMSFGGPIVASGNERETLDALFAAVEKLLGGRRLVHNLTTLDPGYVRYGNYLAERGYRPEVTACRVVLSLDGDWEDIETAMDSSRRRAVRKATKRDHEVEVVPFEGSVVDAFYERHVDVMERVDGHPHPKGFFTTLAEAMGDRVRYVRATVEGTDRGGLLYLLDEEQSSLHYLQSGIREEDFSSGATEVVHRHAIRWAIEEGYATYDFGWTDSDFEDGLFRFKRSFGGDAVPMLSWRKAATPVHDAAYRLGRRLRTPR